MLIRISSKFWVAGLTLVIACAGYGCSQDSTQTETPGDTSSGDEATSPEEVVVDNIKPVGQVYIAGESEPEAPAPAESAAAADAGGAAAGGAMTGDQIYNSSCLACHGTGAAGADGFTAVRRGRADAVVRGIDARVASASHWVAERPPPGGRPDTGTGAG